MTSTHTDQSDFERVCAYSRAVYRHVLRAESLPLHEARDAVLTRIALQVLASLTDRDLQSYDQVVRLLGVSIPLLARGFQALKSYPELPYQLSLSQSDPVLIGWAHQVWNEARRSQQTWAVSKFSEQQHEHVDLVVVTQLFTDDYISEFLVTQALRRVALTPLNGERGTSINFCDPACGTGHILASAVRLFSTSSRCGGEGTLQVYGFDIDPDAIEVCRLVVFLEHLRCGQREGLPELWGQLGRSITLLEGPYGTLDRDQMRSDQRFDVVITNPPYLGRRKLSSIMRTYLDRHYPAGRVDLCGAFMQRCVELTAEHGAIGFVTTDKWLRLAGYEGLRKGDGTFRGLLGELSLDVICELGSRAFHPQMGLHDGVRVSVLCGTKAAPSSEHTFRYCSIAEGSSYECKVRTLRDFSAALGESCTAAAILQRSLVEHDIASTLLQVRDTPPALVTSNRRVRDVADVVVGLQTNDDARYVRWVWETPPDRSRWRVHAKGGGYTRWCGNNRWILDWGRGSTEYFRTRSALEAAETWNSKAGWTYSWFANGSLGLRLKEPEWSIGRAAASGVFCPDVRVIAYLNSRYASLCVRGLGGKIQLPEGVVRNIPIPQDLSAIDPSLPELATALKQTIVSSDPADALFDPSSTISAIELLGIEALLLLVEGCIEAQVEDAIGLGKSERRTFDSRIGMPVARIAPMSQSSWDAFGRIIPASYQTLAPRLRGVLERTFESVPRQERTTRDSFRLLPEGTVKKTSVGSLLPSTSRLEALCREQSMNPIEVVVAYGDRYVEDAEMQRDLGMPVLYARALTAILKALEHRWWSVQESSSRVEGCEYTRAGLCKIVNESRDCTELAYALNEPLHEPFLRRLLALQERVFVRCSPIRESRQGSGIFRHLWDIESSSSRESVALIVGQG